MCPRAEGRLPECLAGPRWHDSFSLRQQWHWQRLESQLAGRKSMIGDGTGSRGGIGRQGKNILDLGPVEIGALDFVGADIGPNDLTLLQIQD